jgi:hypothetical protein
MTIDGSSSSVLLHIGTHKTGTTSFQSLLNDKAAALKLNGFGVYESYLTNTLGLAHEVALLAVRADLNIPLRCMIPDSTLRTMRLEMQRHVLNQSARSEPTLVISHEALSFIRTSSEVECLAKLFPGRRLKVVVVLRDERSFLRSWRNQLSRMGFPSESPYVDSFMNTSPGTWLTDWQALISSFAEVCGPESITAIQYEEAVSEHGSVLGPLWLAMGLPPLLTPGRNEYWLNRSTNERPVI